MKELYWFDSTFESDTSLESAIGEIVVQAIFQRRQWKRCWEQTVTSIDGCNAQHSLVENEGESAEHQHDKCISSAPSSA